MKKTLLAIVAMLGMASAANAQYNVSGHKFFDNWSIGLTGGVATNLHDWDTPNGATAGLQLTKGITPIFGLEFSVETGFNNNANWNVMHSANVVDNVTAMASGKVNLMNWFCGYNGQPRLFEIQGRGGIGYMRNFYPGADKNSAVYKLGLDFDFNLGEKKAWTLSLRPAVILRGQNGISGCDNASQCKRYSHNGVAQLTAGVTYHFANSSNDNHYFTAVAPVVVTNTVERVVEKAVEKPVEKVVEKTVKEGNTIIVVDFDFDKDELTAAAKRDLDCVKDQSVNVVAYASYDGEDAPNNPDYNQKLAQRRADNVKAYLEGKGIKVTQAVGMGIVGYSKRIAVVSPNK